MCVFYSRLPHQLCFEQRRKLCVYQRPQVCRESELLQEFRPQRKFALASPIRFEGTNYGALVILSNHFDIIPSVHGPLLHVLADTGYLLARRDILDFAVCIKGLSHDGLSALGIIRACIGNLRNSIIATEYRKYNNVLDFWGHAIVTHCPDWASGSRRHL